jgi:site-specific DNA recombinase
VAVDKTRKRAGIYGRESKDKTKSVTDQIAAGLVAIDEEGWSHAGTYNDGTSASRYARKRRADWDRLLTDLDAGQLDVLVLWESSRGSREPVDWFGMLNTCLRKGILIHVISHERTYDPARARDWKILADDGVDAAHESNRLSERVCRGVDAAAATGLPYGQVPYGYERIYDERTKKLVEQRPHPVHAPIVREIITRVGRSDPIVHVMTDLNARGIPAPGGGRWHRKTIRLIASNVAYLGKRRHKGEVHNGVWPALVSETEFYTTAQVLNAPNRRATKPGLAKWLVSYLATTPCGGQLHAIPANDHQPRARYTCVVDGCTSIGVAELDQLVTMAIIGRLSQADARDLFEGDTTTAQMARDEAARLRADLDEARDLVGKPPPTGISVASLARIEANLLPLIDAAENRAVAATVPSAVTELVDAARFGETVVAPVWESLPVAARRELIAAFMEIRVGRAARRLSRWADDRERLAAAAERVEITWRQ